jgi:heme-degrading monooxygenase HmoA
MAEHFVWMTTRQIQPGTLGDFERAWRPGTHPEGMLRAYAYWSEDEREIVGISFWASKQACEAWRASEVEARRQARAGGGVRRGGAGSVLPGPRAGRAGPLAVAAAGRNWFAGDQILAELRAGAW